MTAKAFNFKSQLFEILSIFFEGIAFGRTQMQRQREQQALRRRLFAHELFEQHSFMCGVLVYEYDAFVMLIHEIRSPELHQRRYSLFLRASRVGYNFRRGEWVQCDNGCPE